MAGREWITGSRVQSLVRIWTHVCLTQSLHRFHYTWASVLMFQLISWRLNLCLPIKKQDSTSSFYFYQSLGHSQARGMQELLNYDFERMERKQGPHWMEVNTLLGARKTDSCPVLNVWRRGRRGKTKLKWEQTGISKPNLKEPLCVVTLSRQAACNMVCQMWGLQQLRSRGSMDANLQGYP